MRAGAAAAALAALLAACERTPDTASDHYPALGTLVEVTLRGAAPEDTPAAFRAVRGGFARAERDWHAWADGELARHNAALADGGDPVPPAGLDGLLRRAAALRELSGGLFEPGIGALVEAWGFHDPQTPPAGPPLDAIAAWRRGALPVRIDLGGIAKGAAVADALRTLAAHGARHALVNAGGDVAALGDAGDRPWRVGIRNPRGAGVMAGVELLSGEALFTSGDYERAYLLDGVRYHHLLDPRTGYPARGTASLTVLHADPVVADAAATALFIAGDDWPRVAARMGIESVLRVTGNGALQATPEMATRLRAERSAPPVEVIDVRALPAR